MTDATPGGLRSRARAAAPEPTATDPAALRSRAAAVVAELADRLADPRRVASAADEWSALGLGNGHPGVALLFAELAHRDPAHRPTVHAHLAAAVAQLPATAGRGLYTGVPALAFAAHTARRTPEDYAGLLSRLDPALERAARTLLDRDRARLAERRDGAHFSAYDLTTGLAGYARLLLARRSEHGGVLGEVLAHLTRFAEPLWPAGRRVPGWWSPGGPTLGSDGDYPHGHVNFGLAHGAPGILAVLAAALRAGVPVPGLRAAVTGLGEQLLAHRTADGRWPAVIPLPEFLAGTVPEPGGSGWCYGTPGVAGALSQAAEALDRSDWGRTAVDAAVLDLAAPRAVVDTGLCHGWAGLLHLCGVLARTSADPRLSGQRDRLAARVLDAYDPRLPFGFRAGGPGTPHGQGTGHHAGMLTGAAGIALALHAYATDAPPATDWDLALALR
ncbi:lanthionine synthetase C family protein [Streptomyces tubercidicus]|uniref:lanthionine synthetase C family protein n=1 Tax=Streptomyces tubercidicus TaxID=47759 RepID=UPI002E117F1E|nr:lanthionine synthetase C family protein [Streptomyces tubercidicus]